MMRCAGADPRRGGSADFPRRLCRSSPRTPTAWTGSWTTPVCSSPPSRARPSRPPLRELAVLPTLRLCAAHATRAKASRPGAGSEVGRGEDRGAEQSQRRSDLPRSGKVASVVEQFGVMRGTQDSWQDSTVWICTLTRRVSETSCSTPDWAALPSPESARTSPTRPATADALGPTRKVIARRLIRQPGRRAHIRRSGSGLSSTCRGSRRWSGPRHPM